MANFVGGYMRQTGEFVVTNEPWWLGVERHSVEHCTCSFCNRYSLGFKKLPRPGRFEIEVPPKGNEYKWTHISWRWGQWQYYYTLQGTKLFPSIWPFVVAEKWEK